MNLALTLAPNTAPKLAMLLYCVLVISIVVYLYRRIGRDDSQDAIDRAEIERINMQRRVPAPVPWTEYQVEAVNPDAMAVMYVPNDPDRSLRWTDEEQAQLAAMKHPPLVFNMARVRENLGTLPPPMHVDGVTAHDPKGTA